MDAPASKPRRGLLLLSVLCLLINISLDRLTKQIAIDHLKNRPAITFLKETVVLTYAENSGGFLGLFSEASGPLRTVLFLFMPLVVCVITVVYWARNRGMGVVESLSLASVMGGGAGNLVDRALQGYVVDFMNFGIGPVRTGILNVADLSITFGLIVFVLAHRLDIKPSR